MGARAHIHADSPSTAPVKRSALGPSGRPTGHRAPPLTLDHNEVAAGTAHLNNSFHQKGLTQTDSHR